MSSEDLSFTVSLSAQATDGISAAQSVIDEANKIIESLKKEIDEIQNKSPSSKSATSDDDQSEATEFLNSLDTKQLNNLKSVATSPAGFIQGQFLGFLTKLGPQGAAIVGLITAAVSSPSVIIEIVKVLSQPGGPLNRDWRLFIEKQIDIGLTREQEKRKALGKDVQIFVQRNQRGFIRANEVWTANNLIHLNENRISRIGLSDREDGLLP